MLQITPQITISEAELDFDFVRASGPGGQNVNKVATAVKLRFDAAGSPSLPPDVKQRLIRLAGKRATVEGVIVIDARKYRTQHRNRQDAIDRLTELIGAAALEPKKRRKTKVSRAAKQRRIDQKRRHGAAKRLRRPIKSGEE